MHDNLDVVVETMCVCKNKYATQLCTIEKLKYIALKINVDKRHVEWDGMSHRHYYLIEVPPISG